MILLSENLNVIFRSVEEYILLVDSLLDYCLILNERFTVKIRRSKLSESVQKVINIVQDKILAKKLNIKVKTKNLIPELWNTDQVRFEQVIFALLSNSIKFTYAAEISIKFHYFEDHDIIKITVKDHGCGMDHEELARLNELLADSNSLRTTQKISENSTGFGLGLTIAQSILTKIAPEELPGFR